MNDYAARQPIYAAIEKARDSKVIAYVTGDRPGMETQISPEVIDLFVDHLDHIWPIEKLSVILYTNGGDTAAAWRLINLLRTFCDDLEVIVISKALSAGTLICLGADRIVMTKQATLGPIDPSLNNPLAPIIPGGPPGARVPVSVEAVQGYLDVATNELEIRDDGARAQIWMSLSSQIHPLVLGQIFRTRLQIRTLAKRLLDVQQRSEETVEKIVEFLCSDSGSHDHTINRREAEGLGLQVEKPTDDLYKILTDLQKTYIEELELRLPFNPDVLLAGTNDKDYTAVRAVIESSNYGSHQFVSEGKIERVTTQAPGGIPQVGFKDDRKFEAWRKVA